MDNSHVICMLYPVILSKAEFLVQTDMRSIDHEIALKKMACIKSTKKQVH